MCLNGPQFVNMKTWSICRNKTVKTEDVKIWKHKLSLQSNSMLYSWLQFKLSLSCFGTEWLSLNQIQKYVHKYIWILLKGWGKLVLENNAVHYADQCNPVLESSAAVPGSLMCIHPLRHKSCSSEQCCPTTQAGSRQSAPPQQSAPPVGCQEWLQLSMEWMREKIWREWV